MTIPLVTRIRETTQMATVTEAKTKTLMTAEQFMELTGRGASRARPRGGGRSAARQCSNMA